MVDFYIHHDPIFKLIKKCQLERLYKVLRKYSKVSRSFREFENQFEELTRYSKHSRSVKR